VRVILIDKDMKRYFACRAIERGFGSVPIERGALVVFQQKSDAGGIPAIECGVVSVSDCMSLGLTEAYRDFLDEATGKYLVVFGLRGVYQ